ncbi:MAG: VWA domain-containing protein [Oscillatoriales cyanobacterium]|nr:MAG: VWA domain-containing protein [Oscillatoriales cyanobacterium]
MLQNRDYTIIIDKSGSMYTKDQMGGKSRWALMQESTIALANKCEELDPDGITVYVFSGRFKRYENVTSAKVVQIFQENEPSGTTNLAAVLLDSLNSYFQRKASGKTKLNGETILVVTDGEPDDRFIQVGNAPEATKFLKILDDELQSAGAKFDIVDTVTMDDIEGMTLTEVLLNAITD